MAGPEEAAARQARGSQLDFIELGCIGESVCGAFPELAWNFDAVPALPGDAINLLMPKLAADRGDGVAEGAVRLRLRTQLDPPPED